MGRSFASGSSQYLEYGGAVLSGYEVSFSAWVYPVSSASDLTVLGLYNNTTSLEFVELHLRATGTTVRAQQSSSSSSAFATTSATWSANTWQHVGCYFENDTSRGVFLNGGNKATNATSRSFPTGLNVTAIGRRSRSSPTNYFDGWIADAAVWNVKLSDAEFAALGRGVTPRRIRPANLVGYWPLWGLHDPEIDLTVNGRSMALTGAARANHAPVSPFSRIWTPSLGEIEAASAARRMLPPVVLRGWDYPPY